MSLPVYKISIDDIYSDGEDLGISAIAFTSRPAIKVKGFNFSSEEPVRQFFGDKVKNRIVAPIMIPMSIYRSDEEGLEEYYVEFTESEIERIHTKFMKNFTNRQVFNLEHDDENKVNAFVLETWLVNDPENDKAFHTYGIKVPRGSVMMVAQIADSQTYSELVDNEQTGFSIEGYLGLSLSDIIKKKQIKEEKMNEQKFEMKLPPGEYKQGDKTYIVDAEGNVTIKEEEAQLAVDKPKDDEAIAEEVKKEEELADEVPPPAEGASDMYSKAEVDAKFDEVYKMLGEMKSEDVVQDDLLLSEDSGKGATNNKFSDVSYKIQRINDYLKQNNK